VGAERARAFAPGRVNLIGEHTDYNAGLSLAFAIREGVTVEAVPRPGASVAIEGGGEDALVRAVAQELRDAGCAVPGAALQISSDLAAGEGLSSSAALTVAVALALLGLAGEDAAPLEVARLCRRAERRAFGVRTGLLDQLACLHGREGRAALIDFHSVEVSPVELDLGGWLLAVAASGERRTLAGSGYGERRAECARATELLGLESLREAGPADVGRLPEPLDRRLEHVLGENRRVECAAGAVGQGDLAGLGRLLNESHASLRDLYEVSTRAVERCVDRLREAGAAGARMMGGGFGGSVLALLGPGVALPPGARAVAPAAGARLLASS